MPASTLRRRGLSRPGSTEAAAPNPPVRRLEPTHWRPSPAKWSRPNYAKRDVNPGELVEPDQHRFDDALPTGPELGRCPAVRETDRPLPAHRGRRPRRAVHSGELFRRTVGS